MDEDDFVCTFCQDTLAEPCTAGGDCGQHNFCLDCLRMWIAARAPAAFCPLCQAKIQQDPASLKVNLALRDALEARRQRLVHRIESSGAIANHGDLPPPLEPHKVSLDKITFERTKRGERLRIGVGAFASVYAGTFDGEPAAIKSITVGGPAAAEQQRRFWSEVQLQYPLRHDNIVAVLGAAVDDEEEGAPVELLIVQPRMKHTLQQWLDAAEGCSATLGTRLQLLADVAAGLRYIHGKDIIHGDIKPDNVLLDARGTAKLTDFGLALVRPDAEGTRVSLIGMRGTTLYMDAALMVGGSSLRKACDIFSFAIMAWQVLCGRIPYSDVPQWQVQAHVTGGGRPDMAALPPACPASVRELLPRCWALEYASRPKAVDVCSALAVALRHASSGEAGEVAVPGGAGAPPIARSAAQGQQAGADSVFARGLQYATGKGVAQDIAQAVVCYRKAAEQGHAQAQVHLGLCYGQGQGVAKDKAQAVVWYRKAAEQGQAQAQYNLGWCYDLGQGVSQNCAQAVVWYRKAAEQGDAQAQFNLGVCYYQGLGLTKDEAQAVAWYRKAAEQGHARAQYNLGVCYDQGQGVAKDEAQAVVWYRKAAEQGHAGAQFNLSACYYFGQGVAKDDAQAMACKDDIPQIHPVRHGRDLATYSQNRAEADFALGKQYATGQGVPKDMAKACKWYQEAADRGHAEARYNLGVCYEHGQGVPMDCYRAEAHYRKAAELGHEGAQCIQGLRWQQGSGRKDEAHAVYYFRMAARQGHAQAQYLLGLCYNKGQGVAQDKAQAIAWYRKAAEQDHADAQYSLGVCYNKGQSVATDRAQAVVWYRKAAEQGHAGAQYSLGVCYYHGWGVAKDQAQAVVWYRKAAEQGHAGAKYNLNLCLNASQGNLSYGGALYGAVADMIRLLW